MNENDLSPGYQAWLENYRLPEPQDPLFDRAAHLAGEVPRLSVSGLQRRLKIGFARATRLMQALQEAGLVKPREQG